VITDDDGNSVAYGIERFEAVVDHLITAARREE